VAAQNVIHHVHGMIKSVIVILVWLLLCCWFWNKNAQDYRSICRYSILLCSYRYRWHRGGRRGETKKIYIES